MAENYMTTHARKTVTVPDESATSSAVSCLGLELMGMQLPASMDGTTLTLEGSFDGSNFFQLRTRAGAAITYTFPATAGIQYKANSEERIAGLAYIRVITTTTQTTAAVAITLIFLAGE